MLLLDACVPVLTSREPGPVPPSGHPHYGCRMPVLANQVAAALREHLPGVEGGKLHRLLYYVQGHHLALFGRPAFNESVVASPACPEVEGFDDDRRAHVRGVLDQALLNTVLIVANRYGQLTAADLDRLTCAEPPWQNTAAGAEISHNAMRGFFTGDGAVERSTHPLLQPDPERERRIQEEVTRIREGAPAAPDDIDKLLAEVARDARR